MENSGLNCLHVPAVLTLLVQLCDIPHDQPTVAIKTVRQNVTLGHSGPQTILCQLEGFNNPEPRGEFAIGIRSSHEWLACLPELRPIFCGNQLYVTLDLKKSESTNYQRKELAAGKNVCEGLEFFS
jgi:hypothetical protein